MSIERGQLTVGSSDPAEEVPSSTGKDEPRNSAGRELWQGPRNDTVPVNRMTCLSATFPEIW